MKVAIVSHRGKKVKDVEVADSIFAEKARSALVHQVVKGEMASWRAGTHKTKTRGEVSGGGRKPFRQKGTGRARAGSSRSPLWTGGGTVFGPQPRSYTQVAPKKMRKAALRSILSSKLAKGCLVVIENIDFEEPSTKKAAEILERTAGPVRCTVVVGNGSPTALKSFRNLSKVTAIEASEMNVYDLINNRKLVITENALAQMTEVLG